jgi:hypothetical protein
MSWLQRGSPIQLATVLFVCFLLPAIASLYLVATLLFWLSPIARNAVVPAVFFIGTVGVWYLLQLIFWHRYPAAKPKAVHAEIRRHVDQIQKLDQLQTMEPTQFEIFVGQLFELEGYMVEVLGRTGDGGIDLKLERGDKMGIAQIKRYKGHSVGEPVVRDLLGAMVHAPAHPRIRSQVDEAFLVTSDKTTKAAQVFAGAVPGMRLIDGESLMDWLRILGQRTSPFRQGTITPLPASSFSSGSTFHVGTEFLQKHPFVSILIVILLPVCCFVSGVLML